MRRGFTVVELLVVVAVLVVLAGLLGPGEFLSEAVIRLAAGWLILPVRNIPRVAPAWPEVLAGVGGLVAAAGLAHALGRRFVAGWGWRWTARAVVVPVLLFAAGTAAVGVVRHATWLATTTEPRLRREGTSIREIAARSNSANNLKMLGLGAAGFEEKHPALPAPTFTADGRPMHSWHTAMLPFLDREDVARSVRSDLPWDHTENRAATAVAVTEFRVPLDRLDGDPPPATHYAPNAALFDRPRRLTAADFPIGTANTILAAEPVRGPRPWADPLNWRDPALGPAHPAGFGGPWPGVTITLFADGHVRALTAEQWAFARRGRPVD